MPQQSEKTTLKQMDTINKILLKEIYNANIQTSKTFQKFFKFKR